MVVLGPLSFPLEVPVLDAGVRFYTDAGLIAALAALPGRRLIEAARQQSAGCCQPEEGSLHDEKV